MRILIVDDSREFLEAAGRFLSIDPEIEIVGRASSGHEALEKLDRLRPDLVLMDLVMPDMDGLAATREIKKRPGAPPVVIVTAYGDREYRAQAEAAGADGFISKSEFGLQVLPMIRALSSDGGGTNL